MTEPVVEQRSASLVQRLGDFGFKVMPEAIDGEAFVQSLELEGRV